MTCIRCIYMTHPYKMRHMSQNEKITIVTDLYRGHQELSFDVLHLYIALREVF